MKSNLVICAGIYVVKGNMRRSEMEMNYFIYGWGHKYGFIILLIDIIWQQFQSCMSTPDTEYDENQETLEFYKIKLMEKDREISDHAAKLKKIQFKNNRDIKQLKMAEEKAKAQLKEQKLKLDKANKSMAEATEQNNVLQHRLAELKDQKDKEIQSTRAQYNHLKNQVRAYERILPTHTFMSKLGANYEQLPTYQQVFMNWKQRSERFDQLDQKFKKYKTESEEKMEMQLKVSENAQKKKVELQKQLRQDISKMLDLQSQITTIAIQRDQQRNRIHDLTQQLHQLNNTSEQLQQQNKALQAKIQQLARIYHTELQAKEEEIQKITEQEFRKYEDQIERITRTFQMKQNSHLQQLAYFQEEEHRLNQKIQKDKERFEENYRDMFNQVERIKRELDVEKEQHWRQKDQISKIKQQLAIKENQNLEFLQKLGQSQLKIENLLIQVKNLREKLAETNSESNSKYGSVVEEKRFLDDKVRQLTQDLNQARQDIIAKENQIRLLLHEIQEIKNKGNMLSKGNSLHLSNSLDQDHLQQIRKRSNTNEQHELEKVGPTTLTEKQYRNRQNSLQSQSSQKRKVSTIYFTQQQLENKIKEVEGQVVSKYEKILEQKKLVQEQGKQNYTRQINELAKQINEMKKKQEEVQNKLKKIYEENEIQKFQLNEAVSKTNRKYDLLKSEKDLLEQQYLEQVSESKKDKQSLNSLRNQNREQQKLTKQLQRSLQMQNNQVQSLKKYKQKMQAKQNRQKSVSSQSSSTNIKEVIQKYNSQISKLLLDNEELIKSKHDLENQLTYVRKNIQLKEKQIQQLKADSEEKVREIDMLQDLLDHQRKDRTLRTVPSLASLPDQDGVQQQNFKQFYNQAGQKQGQIMLLQRQVSDLKNEIEQLKQKQEQKLISIQQQMNGYIQQLIGMKLKVANAQMKASEKTYLYNQLKKKYNVA